MSRQPTVRILVRPALSACLFLVCANFVFAQPSRQIKAPERLLRDLNEEDRTCVLNEGGLRKHVRVRPLKVSSIRRAILVKGSTSCLCGAQNCGFWIYERVGSTYNLLLRGTGATKIGLGRSFHEGLRDIVAQSHASAIETNIFTFWFTGTQYLLHRCVSRVYYDENGNIIKKPRYQRC